MLRHFLLALVAFCPCLLHAQVTGFSYELDTVFAVNEPFGLANHGVHNVYANLTSASDVVGAVYSDVSALGTPPMGIDAPCGCYSLNSNITFSSPTFLDSAWCAENGLEFPEFCEESSLFDSFWTIGMTTLQDEGQLPDAIGFEDADLCSGLNIESGAVFITGTTGYWPVNAVAGDDLKVLIARVTRMRVQLQACIRYTLVATR